MLEKKKMLKNSSEIIEDGGKKNIEITNSNLSLLIDVIILYKICKVEDIYIYIHVILFNLN